MMILNKLSEKKNEKLESGEKIFFEFDFNK